MKQSHSAEKSERIFVAKYQKIEGPFGNINKFSKKVPQFRKKNRKGGPLGLVRFCRLRWKSIKMKRGTLCTKFPLAGLGLSSLVDSVKSGPFNVRSVVWRKNESSNLLHKKRGLKTWRNVTIIVVVYFMKHRPKTGAAYVRRNLVLLFQFLDNYYLLEQKRSPGLDDHNQHFEDTLANLTKDEHVSFNEYSALKVLCNKSSFSNQWMFCCLVYKYDLWRVKFLCLTCRQWCPFFSFL